MCVRRLRPKRPICLFSCRPTWAKTGPCLQWKTIGRRGPHPNRMGSSSRPKFVFLWLGFEELSQPSPPGYGTLRFVRGVYGTTVRTYPPPQKALKKKRNAKKTRILDAAKKSYPGMFGLSWTKHVSVSRGDEWNRVYESFRVHTQKKGRNVHVKENLPPLKHGQGGVALGCTPLPPSPVKVRSM